MSANRNIYIVGLTGGIASGKSAAAAYLEEQGARTVDADAISHSLTAENGPVLPDIRRVFGDAVFNEDGTLNRGALGAIVFADAEQRIKLESITMPAIQREAMREIDEAEANGDKLIFLNAPLLFETGMNVLCDETWLISVGPDIQLERVMSRDNLSSEQAYNRIHSQMSLDAKLGMADEVIDNNRNIEKMYAKLQSLYSALLRRIDKMDND